MTNTLLNKIIFGAKRIAYQLKEKPKASIDEHVLEHMVFYHGLTGSAPENEKEIRIVAADIKEAIGDKNANALALALKLAPTMWQERLAEIFSQFSEEQKQIAINLLIDGDHSAIVFSDWQVRANAANILAFLNAKSASAKLATTLVGAGIDTRPQEALSFVYVAYALGKLQGENAKAALQIHLSNNDPWLRVDAAGALSYFSFEEVGELLAQALLNEAETLDYMAYAISRQHKPAKFLQANSQTMIKGGCQIICGLIEAAQNAFSKDLVLETGADACLPVLIELAKKGPDPIVVDTMLTLSDYLSSSQNEELIRNVGARVNAPVFENLKSAANGNKISSAELIHSIKLAGRLQLKEAQPMLCKLLPSDYVDYIVEALAKFADENSGTALVNFANQIINQDDRGNKPLSKQPVEEDQPDKAKTYWHILKALGNVRAHKFRPYNANEERCASDSMAANEGRCRGEIYEPACSFLFNALTDYAPDKRAQALESLMRLHKNNPQLSLAVGARVSAPAVPASIDPILQQALKDPSPIMQLTALKAIADLEEISLAMEMIALIDAQENTVSKQALASIACIYKSAKLAESNNASLRGQIKIALQNKLKMIKEEHKKTGITDILHA